MLRSNVALGSDIRAEVHKTSLLAYNVAVQPCSVIRVKVISRLSASNMVVPIHPSSTSLRLPILRVLPAVLLQLSFLPPANLPPDDLLSGPTIVLTLCQEPTAHTTNSTRRLNACPDLRIHRLYDQLLSAYQVLFVKGHLVVVMLVNQEVHQACHDVKDSHTSGVVTSEWQSAV